MIDTGRFYFCWSQK